ncbi:Flavin-linked sulfhydryl oxidase of the mitochondrial IMS [Fusarium piperis]|uniref:Sulfhydryl oxidase n=1 Tax=Fusarium piperis TaxID=1435070 RepID=A0A9W8WAP8_9HYPO|nr:Flavin-linked sulfhydryl oxidase of the mitochondrial IMS [Fusarium piperis]
MAEEPRDNRDDKSSAVMAAAPGAMAPAQGGGSAEPPKRIPRGVVLGPDGKPCRNCTSFAAWAAQTKDTLKHDAARTQTATQGPPADCPPDVEALGRSTWTLLHSIAAQYPEQPSRGQQSDLLSFVGLFSKLYPCWVCAEDFQGYLHRDAPKVGSRDEFGKWLCGAHNEVNRKLGKAEFDCSKWEERWRTGWKDGRCD